MRQLSNRARGNRAFTLVVMAVVVFIATLSEYAIAQSSGTFSGAAAGMMGGPNGKPSKKSHQKKKVVDKIKAPRCLNENSKDDVPGRLCAGGDMGENYTGGVYNVIQIIDDENAIMEEHDLNRPLSNARSSYWMFWLHSPVVKSLKEGRDVGKLDGIFAITGRKRYTTALGTSKTVDLIENAKLPEPEPESIPVKQPILQKQTKQMWHDSSNALTLEAEFHGVTAGKVKLKKEDGTTITMPLEKLSDEDREWIRKRAK